MCTPEQGRILLLPDDSMNDMSTREGVQALVNQFNDPSTRSSTDGARMILGRSTDLDNISISTNFLDHATIYHFAQHKYMPQGPLKDDPDEE